MLPARTRQLPTRWIAVAAIVVWLLFGAYTFHFGATWHLDLRVYRAAGHALYHHGSPFTAYFTANHLPFTYTPFALLVLSPLALGRLGLVETMWWLISAAALIVTLALLLFDSFTMPVRRVWALAGPPGRGGVAGPRAGAQQFQLRPDQPDPDGDDRGRHHPGAGPVAGSAGRAGRRHQAHPAGVPPVLRRGRPGVAVVAAGGGHLRRRHRPRRGPSCRPSPPGTGCTRPSTPAGPDRSAWSATSRGTGWSTGPRSTAATWGRRCGWCYPSPPWPAGWSCAGGWSQASRTTEAVVVLALTELLVSPVSWSHHWSWLAVAPIAVVTLWPVHRAVAVALSVLVGTGRGRPLSVAPIGAALLRGQQRPRTGQGRWSWSCGWWPSTPVAGPPPTGDDGPGVTAHPPDPSRLTGANGTGSRPCLLHRESPG